MKTLLFAFLGGMAASIPALTLFNDAGVSPYLNYEVVLDRMDNSVTSILTYYALILFLPALGSAIGAKLGGRGAEFNYIYGRGVTGQFVAIIAFGLLLNSVTSLGTEVFGMTTQMQTLVALATAQVGCTLGTVWGL